jgi:hypothetical protein
LEIIGRTGVDPTLFTVGQLLVIAQEHDYQRQVDRACAAHSPKMLPIKADEKKLVAAQERIKAEKAQYDRPSNFTP